MVVEEEAALLLALVVGGAAAARGGASGGWWVMVMVMCVDERARWVKGSTRKFVTDILFYKKKNTHTSRNHRGTGVVDAGEAEETEEDERRGLVTCVQCKIQIQSVSF